MADGCVLHEDADQIIGDYVGSGEAGRSFAFKSFSGLEAVNRHRELPRFELCHEVIEEVQRFSAGRHFSDNVCLVQWKLAQ